MRALLLAEAGRIARERQGELVPVDDLSHEAADHGVFGRTDEIEVLSLYLIHHVFHFVEAHDARNDVAVNHKGRNDVSEALIDHKIARIGQNGGMQPCDVARQIIESLSRSAAGGIDVDAVQFFENVEVIGNFKIGNDRFPEAFEFDVFRIVFSDGHIGGDDVGNGHHVLFELFIDFRRFLFDRGEAFRIRDDLRLYFFRLFPVPLFHEHAHLLGEGISRGAERVSLRNQSAAL